MIRKCTLLVAMSVMLAAPACFAKEDAADNRLANASVSEKEAKAPVTSEPDAMMGKFEADHAGNKDTAKKVAKEKAADAQNKAASKVDNVKVEDDPLSPENKKKFSLNPINWIFKPVIDMQKRIIHLEKQMMRLEAPITGLQKPMVGLREDMGGVQQEMKVMHEDINRIHEGMHDTNTKISHIESQLTRMYGPVSELKNPVIALKKPVTGVGDQLTTLKSDLKELKDVVGLTNTAILIAVLGVGFLIVVGTPLVAIMAWRHRHWIIEKLDLAKDDPKAAPMSNSQNDKAHEEKIKKANAPSSEARTGTY